MAVSIFTLVSRDRVTDVLSNLQQFTGLAIQLIDSAGNLLMSFGQSTSYCSILKKRVFDKNECFTTYTKAGQTAQTLGEAYIFSCSANLQHIAVPLINQKELLGSVIIGPFLMDEPDSTVVTDVVERYHLSAALSLELYDELSGLMVLPPAKVNQLKKLVDHLLSPLLPEERILLRQNQGKMSQQAMCSETDKGNPYIRKALRFMADNYSEHLELNQVAEYVELSPSYFSSLFHRVVGESFREHLCKIRVEESKRLLLSQKYALGDIAIAMGFPDQSYYCKVFKRIVGVTPGKYRG